MKQMKQLLSLLLVLCMVASFALPASAATAGTMEQKSITTSQTTMGYWLYTPENVTSDMPLIVFLHGGSGKGSDLTTLTNPSSEDAYSFPKFLYDGEIAPNAYVVIPQLPSSGFTGWNNATASVAELVNHMTSNYDIDTSKISLTGHSMGGTGCYSVVSSYPDLFSRVGVVSGKALGTVTIAKLTGVSIRAYAGSEDTTITAADSKAVITSILAADSTADATYIELSGETHYTADNVAYKGTDLVSWLSFADSTSDDSGSGSTGEEEDDTTGSNSGNSGNSSGTVTYKYAASSTAGEQYILVSNDYAIQNNGGTIAAVSVTVDGDYVTFADTVDASTLLWTIDAEGNLTNNGYYLSRSRLPLTVVDEEPDYKWSYDGADLAYNESTVYYAYYDTDASYFRVVNKAASAELKFYGIETSGGGTTDPSEPEEVTLDYITVSGDKTYGVGGVLALKVTAHYTDGTTADVTKSATFSGYDMNTVGEQLVTASYTEGGVTETATYSIVVTDADAGELFVDKHATLENNGSYTITLEAYATGTPVVTNEPADICLILDVSGSMKQKFDPEYIAPIKRDFETMYGNVSSGRSTYYCNCSDGVYSETEWTLDSTGTYYTWTCTECGADETGEAADYPTIQLYIVDTTTDYGTEDKMYALQNAVNVFIDDVAEKNASITDTSLWSKMAIVKFAGQLSDSVGNDTYGTTNNPVNYSQILTELQTVNSTTAETMKSDVSALVEGGGTATDYGMQKAVEAMEDSSDRQKVYILFTDGIPTGATGTAFDEECANAAIEWARQEKAEGAIIYTIAIVDGADPADTSDEYINMFLNAVSSNYPNATAYNNLGSGNNYGYYMVAGDADELISLYDFISKTTIATTVELDAESQLIDYLNTGFELNDSYSVTAETAAYAGKVDGQRTWAEPTKLENATVTVENGAVTVSGFDYKNQCIADATEETAVQGSKLIVTIRGVEATDAVIASGVMTNKNTSGIYDEGSMVDDFPKPTTTLAKATYVLDYAKTAELAMEDFLQTEVNHLDVDGMNQFSAAVTELEHKYGDVAATNGKLTYTPDTMQWDGYDTFYAFGKTNDTEVKKQEANGVHDNIWSKISVLPANNVYYEDTFVTEAEDEESGRVGIVYTGEFKTVTEGDNTETPESAESETNGNHGWIDALDGELTDTDGTATGATVSSSTTATATFTFTGTGVDIYSRTTPTSGTILVTIKGTTEEGTSVANAKVIDTVSYSGEYYQVPTCTFDKNDGLSYGTYTVTINVTTAAENRYTYYLDGIRVYNPLSHADEDADQTVQDAYGDEIHSYFEEIRNDLIDQSSESLTGGAVFIDKDKDAVVATESAVVGIYEDFGPKNEVYLKADQMIVMNVTYTESVKYYVGMKLLNGGKANSVTAGIMQADGNKATVAIDHSADMYYEVTPVADGSGNYTITIQNMSEGSALLSITKLKVTNVPGATVAPLAFMMDISTEDALAVANLAYAAPVVDTEIPTEPEEDVTEPTEPETEPTEPETPDVEIVNPGIDEETLEQIQNTIEEQAKQLEQLVNKLFGAFSKWFR